MVVIIEFFVMQLVALCYTIPFVNDPNEKDLKNMVGKEHNTGNQRFLLFPILVFIQSHTVHKSFLCRKELTLPETTNFRLFQTESVCRRHFQI